jgi:hypothetical protein
MGAELPAGDAPAIDRAGFTRMEIARLRFLRYLIERGVVNEEGYRLIRDGCYRLYTGDYSFSD